MPTSVIWQGLEAENCTKYPSEYILKVMKILFFLISLMVAQMHNAVTKLLALCDSTLYSEGITKDNISPHPVGQKYLKYAV